MTDNRDAKQPPGWSRCASEQVQVMLLGTYHMDNPELDEVNVGADDVLASERQGELRTLTTQLARWRPERIAVERPYDRSDTVNALYEGYRTGERYYNREETIESPHPARTESTTECRSDIIQIGFRLAEELDHDRVYPIDSPTDLTNDEFEELEARDYQPEDKVSVSESDPELIEQEFNNRLANSTIPEYHRWLNQEEQLRTSHERMFGRFLRWGEGDNYGGPRALSIWYERNLRMAHNLWRALEEGDKRLLCIVGSGHIRILRHLLTEAPMFCPVSPLSYL